jgi:hypothetical protein
MDNGQTLALILIGSENRAIADAVRRAKSVAELEQAAVRLHRNIESLRRVELGLWRPAHSCFCGHPNQSAHECDK